MATVGVGGVQCTSRLLPSLSAYAYDVTVVTVAVSKYLELTNDIYANFMKQINKKPFPPLRQMQF